MWCLLVVHMLRPSDRLLLGILCDTEQLIHSLQRDALGFRNEEPDEEEHGEAEAAKNEVGATIQS